MAAHSIPLNTLKQCLQFLGWLHSRQGKKVQTQVANALHERLKGKYQDVSESQIASALSNFLSSVSKFHKNLWNNTTAIYNGNQDPTAVLDALLECIPMFLAVMYFLRYQVDANFAALGGGKWADKPVGGSAFIGRELQAYFTAPSRSKTYGIIPGGFRKQELKRLYRQGSFMANDLEQICQKHNIGLNVFLDVFSTSVLPQNSGTQDSNTANALALVRTLCEIVGEEKDGGGELITKLNEHFKNKQNRICWNNLKAHCEKLKSEFSNIFADRCFSFTGFGREVKDLKKEEFGKEAADWLRRNLEKVRGNLEKIETDNTMKYTAEYFTKHLFTYGFTFYGTNIGTGKDPHTILQENWADVINELRKPSEGLDRLKTILDGQQCPEESDKKSEGSPNQGKKSEGSPNQGKKSEGAQNQGKKTEGAQNQGKKSEGAQNQGKKVEGTPNQSKGQIDISSSGSQDIKSLAPGPSPGGPGGTGQPGSKGNKGDAGPPGSTGPVTPASSQVPAPPVQNADQTQQPSQPPPAPPPPPPPPPLPGGGVIPPNSVPPDQDSPDSVSSGQKPTATPVTVSPQTPGVSHAQPVPTGDKGAGPPGGGGTSKAVVKAPSKIGGKPVQTDENCPRSKGYKQIELWPGRGNYCVKDFDYKQQEAVHKQFDEQIKKAQSDIQERKRQREEKLRQQREVEERKREAKEERRKEDERRRQEEVEESKRKLLQGMEMRTKILNKHPGRPMYPGADRVEDEFREIHLKSHPGTKLTTDHPGTNAVIVEEASASGAKGIPKSTLSHKFPPSDILLGYPIKPPKLPMKYPPVSPHAVPAFADVLEGIDLTKKKRTTERPSVITYNDNAPMTAQMDVVPINYPSNVTGGIIKPNPIKSSRLNFQVM
ncbi:Ribosome-binding protein 1, putative [Babesia ovata]|uniref:Ribosome-binding protein 1, putative n=1 Tax=Babesia ovata TaxID=189622 RepID=A0A2H6KI00_9APIC|nr:Ribosome-binding protein 1, putative [Babesia ovata]GBE62599.1 Ribosome-binding protein 1, putative [Babesia ovata]